MTLNTRRPRVPHTHVCYQCHRIPHISFMQFHSMASCFQVAGHFAKRPLKKPKMTLTTTRSKVPFIIIVTSVPGSILLYSFWVTGFKEVHQMTPISLKGWTYLTYMNNLHPRPKFSSISLYDKAFPRYWQFFILSFTKLLHFNLSFFFFNF